MSVIHLLSLIGSVETTEYNSQPGNHATLICYRLDDVKRFQDWSQQYKKNFNRPLHRLNVCLAVGLSNSIFQQVRLHLVCTWQ